MPNFKNGVDVGQRNYTSSTLPASLPAGTSVVVDGVSVEGAGNYIRRTSKPGKPHLIGPRNFFPDTINVVSSLTRGYLIYKPVTTDRVLTGLEFVFANWAVQSNGAENSNTSTVTVKAGIQFEGSTDVIPIFVNGARTFTMSAGVTVKTDRAPVYIDPKVTTGFFLRIWVSVPSATDSVCSSSHLTGYESTLQKTYRIDGATNDFVDNTAYSTAGKYVNPYEFGPVATLGYSDDGSIIPSVAILGSSSAVGAGDSLAQSNTQYVLGYLARSLKEKNIPYINTASSGETALNFLTDGGAKRRMVLAMCNCTYAVSTYGSNDIGGGGVTYEVMLSRLVRLNQLMLGLGCKPYFCTYTPATSSTDAWATVDNQVVGSVIRLQASEWLRSSSGFNVIDLEKWSDSGRVLGQTASGKWRVDLGQPTIDGLHGTPIMHKTIQDGINQDADSWAGIRF